MVQKLLLALASATLLGMSGCAGMKNQVATTPTTATPAEAPTSILQASTTRPRFIAEAIRMRADDETGFDSLGSDEVIGLFQSQGHGMVTGIYGDMDTGNTAQFRTGQRCLWGAIDPDGQFNHTWACDPVGSAGPITFTVTLYEYDGPVRGGLTNPTQFCLNAGGDLDQDGCQVRIYSTVIGRYRISFSETDLVGAMSAPGDTYTNSFVIDGCSDLVTQGGGCAGPSWGTYTFTFQITRTADEVEQAPRPAPHQ